MLSWVLVFKVGLFGPFWPSKDPITNLVLSWSVFQVAIYPAVLLRLRALKRR